MSLTKLQIIPGKGEFRKWHPAAGAGKTVYLFYSADSGTVERGFRFYTVPSRAASSYKVTFQIAEEILMETVAKFGITMRQV